MSRCRRPLSRARSVPGLMGRYRSARSAVAVRRGSTTMSRAPCLSRSAIRRKRIGWQSAMFEPMTKKRSARSMSSYEPGGPSAPSDCLYPVPADAMHSRELDSMCSPRRYPLTSLFDRYCASIDICPETYSATASGPCSSTMARSRRARLRDGGVQRHRHGLLAARGTDVGRGHAPGSVHEVDVRRTLGAQASGVRRVGLVTHGFPDHESAGLARARRHPDAATDSAVRAHRSHLGRGRAEARLRRVRDRAHEAMIPERCSAPSCAMLPAHHIRLTARTEPL